MKKRVFKTLWAAVWAAGVSTLGCLPAFATEQVQERGASVMVTMDVIQTVSMIVLICAAVLIFAFYLAKAVLKKMYVAPEEGDKDKNKED